jgi:hypothetical protein
MVRRAPVRGAQGGFIMALTLLLLMVVTSVMFLMVRRWELEVKSIRERDLYWMGGQFSAALGSYALATPAGLSPTPRELTDLLRDDRSPVPRQHLRRLYVDPMTARADWAVVRAPDGGIVGVHSRSRGRPLPRDGLWPVDPVFQAATRYSDWVFVAGMRVSGL